ncbi:aldehyde dehydrogenase family protein [Hyphomicrobium sp. 2TAF46]
MGIDIALIVAAGNAALEFRLLQTAAFFNTGQVCLALKRLYVHVSQYDAMCAELAKLARETVYDDGLQQGTAIGF